MGHPGAGPVLLLPPEFIAQQAQLGGPFGWPMGMPMGPGMGPRPHFGQPFPGSAGGFPMPAPAAPSREVRARIPKHCMTSPASDMLCGWAVETVLHSPYLKFSALLGCCRGAQRTRRQER
jgi:hypothetical protein